MHFLIFKPKSDVVLKLLNDLIDERLWVKIFISAACSKAEAKLIVRQLLDEDRQLVVFHRSTVRYDLSNVICSSPSDEGRGAMESLPIGLKVSRQSFPELSASTSGITCIRFYKIFLIWKFYEQECFSENFEVQFLFLSPREKNSQTPLYTYIMRCILYLAS
ncbi:hypothetical protein AVEN_54622-1 [Araneus ventricosus]|uniref:Uncharacterized protein n=1 Tax=Araneus ventricosus TaxID=182803 RepID=A0A4Y2BL50_ARAVE|nr:hypothetical protein AVEN_54622-1 [Araneus ventricosus]